MSNGHKYKVEKHHPEGKNKKRTYSPIQRENGSGTKMLGKSYTISETKKSKKRKRKGGRRQTTDSDGNRVWLLGRMHVVCSMYYGHTYTKSKDQPGKVANPARGQLNRKNEYFPVTVRA